MKNLLNHLSSDFTENASDPSLTVASSVSQDCCCGRDRIDSGAESSVSNGRGFNAR